MLNFQDIQINDKANFTKEKQDWGNSDYTAAKADLANIDKKRWLNANSINTLTDKIVATENLDDPDFKANAPITSVERPQLNNLQIWFQVN